MARALRRWRHRLVDHAARQVEQVARLEQQLGPCFANLRRGELGGRARDAARVGPVVDAPELRALELQHEDLAVIVVRREALATGRREVGRAADREAKVLLQLGAQLEAGLVVLLRVHHPEAEALLPEGCPGLLRRHLSVAAAGERDALALAVGGAVNVVQPAGRLWRAPEEQPLHVGQRHHVHRMSAVRDCSSTLLWRELAEELLLEPVLPLKGGDGDAEQPREHALRIALGGPGLVNGPRDAAARHE